MEVDAPGTALLSISRFGSILRECSGDARLFLETTQSGTLVRGERSEFRLPGENPEEFPTVTPFSEGKYHELPARLLRELVRRTLFATDNESSRYALGGVLLEMTDKQDHGRGHRRPPPGEDGRAGHRASAAIKMPTR